MNLFNFIATKPFFFHRLAKLANTGENIAAHIVSCRLLAVEDILTPFLYVQTTFFCLPPLLARGRHYYVHGASYTLVSATHFQYLHRENLSDDLPPWLSGLAISGRGAAKAWLAIRQGVGSYPTPAGMSSQVPA